MLTGGASVTFHVLSKESQGLFYQAIIQSDYSLVSSHPDSALPVLREIADMLGTHCYPFNTMVSKVQSKSRSQIIMIKTYAAKRLIIYMPGPIRNLDVIYIFGSYDYLI